MAHSAARRASVEIERDTGLLVAYLMQRAEHVGHAQRPRILVRRFKDLGLRGDALLDRRLVNLLFQTILCGLMLQAVDALLCREKVALHALEDTGTRIEITLKTTNARGSASTL